MRIHNAKPSRIRLRVAARSFVLVALAMVTGLGVADARRTATHTRHRARASARHVCDPITGDAVRADIKMLNRLKNREAVPAAADFNGSVSLSALLTPGDDQNRFSEKFAGTVVGYVANAIVGGVETVNCHAIDPHDRDTHIELTLTPAEADDGTRHVIVEVTPRWRAPRRGSIGRRAR
jgi:hypothetical protein